MGTQIDLERIEKMMRDNPEDWHSPEESAGRFDAVLKKALNVTGPKVTVRDVKGYGGAELFAIDVDLDTIVERSGSAIDRRRP